MHNGGNNLNYSYTFLDSKLTLYSGKRLDNSINTSTQYATAIKKKANKIQGLCRSCLLLPPHPLSLLPHLEVRHIPIRDSLDICNSTSA